MNKREQLAKERGIADDDEFGQLWLDAVTDTSCIWCDESHTEPGSRKQVTDCE